MQKELLDTELDLYKKMQAGEEVTELRRKYTELQLEVCYHKYIVWWRDAYIIIIVNLKIHFSHFVAVLYWSLLLAREKEITTILEIIGKILAYWRVRIILPTILHFVDYCSFYLKAFFFFNFLVWVLHWQYSRLTPGRVRGL